VPERDEALRAPVDPRVAAAIVDVFVYVVVLNLFVEYFPLVLTETFKARFKAATTPIGKVGAAFLLWLVLFGSKFLVLEAVGLVFGSSVSLGGFFSVTLLIIVLMLARAAVRRLLRGAGSEISQART